MSVVLLFPLAVLYWSKPTAAFIERVVAQEAPAEEVWQVDQLRLAPDTPDATLKALEPYHTMDAVIARLKRLGVPFTRASSGILADRLPPKVREELLKLPRGEPFVLPGSDYTTINVIIGRRLPADMVRYVPAARADAGFQKV